MEGALVCGKMSDPFQLDKKMGFNFSIYVCFFCNVRNIFLLSFSNYGIQFFQRIRVSFAIWEIYFCYLSNNGIQFLDLYVFVLQFEISNFVIFQIMWLNFSIYTCFFCYVRNIFLLSFKSKGIWLFWRFDFWLLTKLKKSHLFHI